MRQRISIDGMGCEHCVTAVREALEGIDGVDVETVEIGTAVIEKDARAADAQVDEAIRTAGYETASRVEA